MPSFVARLTWSPSLDLEVGVSGHYGPYDDPSPDGLPVGSAHHLSLLALDLDATVAGFRVSGEGGWAHVDIPAALAGINAESQRGAYLDVLRDLGRGVIATMPGSYFTIGARIEAIDFDTSLPGDDTRQLSVGANFRPGDETAFKFAWVRGRNRDRFNVPEQFARLQFSVATYF